MLDGLLEGFEVVVTLPVSWGDMDAYQHVNNTRYFRYFEDARVAYFERTGIGALAAGPVGTGPVLASTSCRFKAPIAYPDEVQVGARVVSVGRTSFKMDYRVVSVALHCVAAEGQAVVVAYDFDEGRKVVIPDAWRRALSSVENCDFAVDADAD